MYVCMYVFMCIYMGEHTCNLLTSLILLPFLHSFTVMDFFPGRKLQSKRRIPLARRPVLSERGGPQYKKDIHKETRKR